MTEERLKLHEKAETRINAIIDTLSQDKGGLADKLKQEDVKDFLVSLWVDCSTEATKELEKKNAELKLKLEALEGQTPWKDIKDKSELIKENAQLKKEWQEQVQKATDEGYARTLQTMQLSKAKEIIKNFLVYVPVDLKEYEEAKQFLKECK